MKDKTTPAAIGLSRGSAAIEYCKESTGVTCLGYDDWVRLIAQESAGVVSLIAN